MQNMLQDLNPEQLAAVTLPAQSALILAGAGSGKTRVLTTRIAWLLQTRQVSPREILAVTFTNKASKEMSARLSAMLPINTRSMWIGTFHGLCNRILRTHHQEAALPQTFQILDMQDQMSAVKRLLKTHDINTDRFPPRNLMHFINGAKEEGLRAGAVEVHDDYNRKLVELYDLYDTQCQREGVADFSELLLRCFELLSRNQVLREHYQARFKHILIDEFQDTNNLQYKWLKLLAGEDTALFAVGDDDQSIYAFRGANVGNMAAFEREFKVDNLIRLEQNYRSHGHILDSANELITRNTKRLGKTLRTDAGHGEQLRVYEASSDLQEARWMIDEIRNLIAEGISRSDMAILYRSNAQSRVIEHALFSAAIPYRVYGGQRFFERAEIKHAIAYLQLINNPDNDASFLRIVNFPTRGIGTRALEQLQDAAQHHQVSLFAAIPYVAGKAGTMLSHFSALIDNARQDTASLPLPELVQIVLERSMLLTHYQKEKEGADRLENLEQLVSAASLFLKEEGFDDNAPAQLGPQTKSASDLAITDNSVELLDAEAPLPMVLSPLSGFLSHAVLEAGESQANAGQEAVQLMTVHAAKGLEFRTVFITGLEEGLFPHESSAKEANGLEEERRLMYVAITRAMERLYLSFAQTRMLHGQTRYNLSSRFLDELPTDALKWLSPKRQDNDYRATTNTFFSSQKKPKLVTAANEKATGWRIGQAIFHKKFGEGVVVNLEGGEGAGRIQINFGRVGMKLLDLTIAKLGRTADEVGLV